MFGLSIQKVHEQHRDPNSSGGFYWPALRETWRQMPSSEGSVHVRLRSTYTGSMVHADRHGDGQCKAPAGEGTVGAYPAGMRLFSSDDCAELSARSVGLTGVVVAPACDCLVYAQPARVSSAGANGTELSARRGRGSGVVVAPACDRLVDAQAARVVSAHGDSGELSAGGFGLLVVACSPAADALVDV